MKIMMICDYPLTASDITGGVAAAAFNLVQALLANTPVEIIVIGYWHDFLESEPVITVNGRLRVIRCPLPRPRAHLRGYRRERRLFSRFIKEEKPDIVHAQSEGIYASVAVNSDCPNVYTIHGVALKELEMLKPDIGLISYILRSRLIRQHHRKATNIVAINRYTKNAIGDLQSAKIRIIHNAVDERFFDIYSPDDKEPGALLLVGGVRLRKDIFTCLEAMSLLVSKRIQVKLDIVGPNDDGLLAQVRNRIDENELHDTVRIHGLVSASAVENFYKKADIFVLSSVEESSPIAIVQAMAAGLPIVSTNVGGIAEMVADTKNSFLVDAGDSAALADNIEKLVMDRDLRHRFANASRQLAVEEWSTKAVALKTFEMYKEIISE